MIDDVLDLYREDNKSKMSDELFEAYMDRGDWRDDEFERATSEDEQDGCAESLKSQCTTNDKTSASKYTVSTKESQMAGKKIGKQYEPLRDEGKIYRYEEDPKNYMKIRKYFYGYLGKFKIEKVQEELDLEKRMEPFVFRLNS